MHAAHDAKPTIDTPSHPSEARAAATDEAAGTGAAPAPSDPATRMLMGDHRETRALLERYRMLADAGADAHERDAVGDELCELLIVHAVLEEEIFYPAAAAAGVEDAMLDGAEHGRVRDGVARFRALALDDADRSSALVEIAEAACRHGDEEEAGLFVACRTTAMDLEALAERLNERQAELLVNREGRAQAAQGGLMQLVKKVFG